MQNFHEGVIDDMVANRYKSRHTRGIFVSSLALLPMLTANLTWHLKKTTGRYG